MTPEEWENQVHSEGDMWPALGEIANVIRLAVAEEREACAKLAEGIGGYVAAEMIRARKP